MRNKIQEIIGEIDLFKVHNNVVENRVSIEDQSAKILSDMNASRVIDMRYTGVETHIITSNGYPKTTDFRSLTINGQWVRKCAGADSSGCTLDRTQTIKILVIGNRFENDKEYKNRLAKEDADFEKIQSEYLEKRSKREKI